METIKERYKGKVFVEKQGKRISAEIEVKESSMEIRFEDKIKSVALNKNNVFETLRQLDDELNKEGYKIICNGTSLNVWPAGFCLNMGDGSLAYRFGKGEKAILIKVLEYNDWNEYATKENQKKSINQHIKKDED